MTNDPLTDNIELWVSRAALETVVTAAMEYTYHFSLVEDWKQVKVEAAVKVIQDAVHDAFEDPLDI